MKRLASAFAVSLVLVLTIRTNAQTANPSAADSAAVEATVRNYIEAYYNGDARRMQQTLHPRYLKHIIDGDSPLREKTASQMVKDVSTKPSLPAADKTEQISVLDIAGDIASAKLVTPHWVDYLSLSKVDGQWKILSVVQRIED